MARTGKIARLPRHIRTQLNTRLADGAEAAPTLQWLNALPETQTLLAEKFNAQPVSEQNLSYWRNSGYQEWLLEQDLLAHAQDLAACRHELQTVAPGQSFADHLAAAVAFRYSAILAAQGQDLDAAALAQLRALGQAAQAVVKLRRSDHNAARLKIEAERWELQRPNLAAKNAEELKQRQRDALAAPVWAALRSGEYAKKFGDSPPGRFAVEYLREIESCKDPAHFRSKALSVETLANLRCHAEERRKNPPVRQTDVQAAIEMIREIDAALDQYGDLKPAPSAQNHRPPCLSDNQDRQTSAPPAPAPATPAPPANPPPPETVVPTSPPTALDLPSPWAPASQSNQIKPNKDIFQ